MSVDYRELELKLRKLAEKRLEEGWGLRPGAYVRSTGECCVVGAIFADLVIYDGPGVVRYECEPLGAARSFVGVASDGAIASLISGFDNGGIPHRLTADRKLFAIAARIRRDYCEWE